MEKNYVDMNLRRTMHKPTHRDNLVVKSIKLLIGFILLIILLTGSILFWVVFIPPDTLYKVILLFVFIIVFLIIYIKFYGSFIMDE
jgi:membrane protein YdbS with pleckstrin-like domain